MLSLALFWSLRLPVRSLIFLFWVYSFVHRSVNVFAQIYIYRMFDSVPLNVIAAMANFTGIMIGFCIFGAVTAQFRLNAKYGFPLSFVFTALGLMLLPAAGDIVQACGAQAIKGVGAGLFWLTVHTYELKETHDRERDVYSTFLSAGEQIVTVAAPAFATLLIWLSHKWGLGEFTLLFLATPPIFLAGLPALAALHDYRPAPIRRHDLVHFFTDRRNQAVQIYLMGGSASHILLATLIPLASITVLGTALKVGGFNTLFAVAGALTLLAVGSHRRPENRLAILGISSIILGALNLMLGLSLTFFTLVVYTAAAAIMQPVMRVSQHVIDLKAMDGMSHEAGDFYPTMIFRDVAIWFWRMAAGLAFLAFAQAAGTGREAISYGMFSAVAAIAITYLGARIFLAWER